MPLKTDYKNDVLDTSKNTKRKYQQTTNSDGTISLDDVTVYSQEGSLLGASDINATNSAVNELNQNLTTQDGEPFRYAKQDGKRGYIVNEEGADTFYPFSGTMELLGQYLDNGTLNLITIQLNKEISKYKYIIFSLSELNNDCIISENYRCLLAITDVSYFKSNSITGNSYAGSSGSAVVYNNVLSYVNDLSISWKKNFNSSRNLYVYGI